MKKSSLILFSIILFITLSVVFVYSDVTGREGIDDSVLEAGIDVFNSVAVIDIKIDDSNERVRLTGPVIISRTSNPILNGNAVTFETEIVSMQLSGVSDTFGNIILIENPDINSAGKIKFIQRQACLVRPINFILGTSFFNVSAIINTENPKIEQKLNISLNGKFNATKKLVSINENNFHTTNLRFNLKSNEIKTDTLKLKFRGFNSRKILTLGDSFYNTNFYEAVVKVETVAQGIENVIQSSKILTGPCFSDCFNNCGLYPIWDIDRRFVCIANCFASDACVIQDDDGDGISDSVDNCPSVNNLDQSDIDRDGFGNVCDCGLVEPSVNAEASETCDGLDNDCNGFVDDGANCFEDPAMCGFTDSELALSVLDKISNYDIGVITELPEIINVGSISYLELPISTCRAEGGFVAECIPSKVVQKPSLGANVSFNQTNITSQFANNLTRDVNSTGIANHTYTNTTYDCDDFADDLETNLTTLGYNATFTAIWCYDAAGNTIVSHAVTDVHVPDGTIIFIEPQTGQIINLDADGDGVVGARTHHSPARADTDNRCEIEIHNTKASAAALGAPID